LNKAPTISKNYLKKNTISSDPSRPELFVIAHFPLGCISGTKEKNLGGMENYPRTTETA
jgi:hypothetical protein